MTARVSICFDNTDKSNSPMGYSDYDQIIIMREIKDGKSQFYINGVKKAMNVIKYLFKQVGLDIDNSFRFFVQQGTIARIVQFRAEDIWKLIEETAGVAQYNKEQDDAISKVQEKTKALDNTEERLAVLKEKLERNAQKKLEMQSYKELEKNFDTNKRFYRAFNYYNLITTAQVNQERINDLKNNINNKNSDTRNIKKSMGELEEEIKQLQKNLKENPKQQAIEKLEKKLIEEKENEKVKENQIKICYENKQEYFVSIEKEQKRLNNQDLQKISGEELLVDLKEELKLHRSELVKLNKLKEQLLSSDVSKAGLVKVYERQKQG